MNVLVTGGGGFIGSAVAARLATVGHRAVIFDRPANVCHPRDIDPAVAGVDAVIHLAGVLGTDELFDSPLVAIDVNMGGTVSVLEACRQHRARYVGITVPDVFPSVYTATKIGAARLESAWHHTYGVPVSRVRAFNAYGPGQRHGAEHPRKIVPTFATEAWAGRPIPIWRDGTQTVDLVDVDDVARMLVDAAMFGDDCTFDAGTGQPWSVNEVADMVLDLTGSTAGVEYLPMRRGEVASKVAADGEGWERLGWRPTFNESRFIETVLSYRPV